MESSNDRKSREPLKEWCVVSEQPLIVVVDDDPLPRKIIEHKLVSRGYRVQTAEDGDEALRLNANTRPQIVMLDAMMLGADGSRSCAA